MREHQGGIANDAGIPLLSFLFGVAVLMQFDVLRTDSHKPTFLGQLFDGNEFRFLIDKGHNFVRTEVDVGGKWEFLIQFAQRCQEQRDNHIHLRCIVLTDFTRQGRVHVR